MYLKISNEIKTNLVLFEKGKGIGACSLSVYFCLIVYSMRTYCTCVYIDTNNRFYPNAVFGGFVTSAKSTDELILGAGRRYTEVVRDLLRK